MPRGLMFKTVEDLELDISAYFGKCESRTEVPTTAGLAYHLGFQDRQSLYDYQKRKAFSCAIKKAILRIQAHHEAALCKQACAGSIFWLKNHGWTDQQQHTLANPDGSPLLTGIKVIEVGR